MSSRRYSDEVKRELDELILRASERIEIDTLKTIARVISRWKRDRITPQNALDEIRRLASSRDMPWTREADPGVPVAHALSRGILHRSDLSDQAWLSIEYLVALAEI